MPGSGWYSSVGCPGPVLPSASTTAPASACHVASNLHDTRMERMRRTVEAGTAAKVSTVTGVPGVLVAWSRVWKEPAGASKNTGMGSPFWSMNTCRRRRPPVPGLFPTGRPRSVLNADTEGDSSAIQVLRLRPPGVRRQPQSQASGFRAARSFGPSPCRCAAPQGRRTSRACA